MATRTESTASATPPPTTPKLANSNGDTQSVIGELLFADDSTSTSSAFDLVADSRSATADQEVDYADVASTELVKIDSRNCVHIDKSQPFPFAVTTGSLYLTRSCLVFKYHKMLGARRNMRITLAYEDVDCVTKTCSFKSALVPGAGRALEVQSTHRDRPYLFAGIIKRDTFCDALVRLAQQSGTQIRVI